MNPFAVPGLPLVLSLLCSASCGLVVAVPDGVDTADAGGAEAEPAADAGVDVGVDVDPGIQAGLSDDEVAALQCIDAPLRVCRADDPCVRRDGEVIATASDVPTCVGVGVARSFENADGDLRHACLVSPDDATTPLPLVIWMSGAGGSADNLFRSTDLADKARSATALGERGFHLVALQSRNLHNTYAKLDSGQHFDVLWWDLRAPSNNPDVRDLDQIVAALVDDLNVDTARIYVMGWSTGGIFAQLYGMARHETPSPAGHTVAAVAVFSGSSPFSRRVDGENFCHLQVDEGWRSAVPVQIVSYGCDVVACDEVLNEALWERGSFADTVAISTWTAALRDDWGNPNVAAVLLDDDGAVTDACEAPAPGTLARAVRNHLTWPRSQETGMLEQLARHRSP